MRILLADDHTILRSGLRHIISEVFPRATVAEVASFGELRDKVRESSWTLLVLDIALGDRNSLELVPDLLRLRPEMKIIVLSMYGERQFVIRSLRAGVLGYLTKDRAPEELLQAIGNVLAGKRYLSESVAGDLADYLAQGSDLPHDQLSAREYEVFLALAAAHTVSEIATQLNLSVKTISTYRTRILEKLGISSNAQIMRYALQHGLIQ